MRERGPKNEYRKEKKSTKNKSKNYFQLRLLQVYSCPSMSIELCNRQLATVHFAPGPAAHRRHIEVH